MKTLKPSDFTIHPYSSILKKSEAETIAVNIMVILKRTGNAFRPLSYDEYKAERLKDGNYTDAEEYYFKQVIPYCKNADTAQLFCPKWRHDEKD
jgi:hypothetical protein